MDRPTTSVPNGGAAMRTAGGTALDLLLPAAAGERGEPAPAPKTGRTLSPASVLGQPSDGCHAESQSQTHPATDAHPGYRSPLPEAELEPTGAGSRDLSVPAARRLDRAAQSSLEHRYYLCPDAGRLPLPGRRHGLVQPVRASMRKPAAV